MSEFKIIRGFHFKEKSGKDIKKFIESLNYGPHVCVETDVKKPNSFKISDNKYIEIIAYCQTDENANMIIEALNKMEK